MVGSPHTEINKLAFPDELKAVPAFIESKGIHSGLFF
jgi:hypothetical protein